MPKDARLAELLGNFMATTHSDRMRWTSVDGKSFEVSAGDFTFNITRDSSEDSSSFEYFIMLKDLKLNKVIKTYYVVDSDPDYPRAQALFEAARDNAYQVDQVIDKMISEIQKSMAG